MIKIQMLILILLNVFLTPIYLVFFILSFFVTFIPIYPNYTAKKNIQDHLFFSGLKINLYLSLIYMNYFFYFLEGYLFSFLKLNRCVLAKDSMPLDVLFQETNQIYPNSTSFRFVFVLSHMANMEMYALPIIKELKKNQQHHRKKLYALAKPSRLRMATKLMEWYRRRSDLEIIWTNQSLIRSMIRAIDDGHSICILADQKPKKDDLFLRFFENFSAFPTSGLKICMNKNMVVIYASAWRLFPGFMKLKLQMGKNVHFESQKSPRKQRYANDCHLDPAPIFNFENISEKNRNVALEMSYFASWIEKEIRRHPTQWSWDYGKWSRKVRASNDFAPSDASSGSVGAATGAVS